MNNNIHINPYFKKNILENGSVSVRNKATTGTHQIHINPSFVQHYNKSYSFVNSFHEKSNEQEIPTRTYNSDFSKNVCSKDIVSAQSSSNSTSLQTYNKKWVKNSDSGLCYYSSTGIGHSSTLPSNVYQNSEYSGLRPIRRSSKSKYKVVKCMNEATFRNPILSDGTSIKIKTKPNVSSSDVVATQNMSRSQFTWNTKLINSEKNYSSTNCKNINAVENKLSNMYTSSSIIKQEKEVSRELYIKKEIDDLSYNTPDNSLKSSTGTCNIISKPSSDIKPELKNEYPCASSSTTNSMTTNGLENLLDKQDPFKLISCSTVKSELPPSNVKTFVPKLCRDQIFEVNTRTKLIRRRSKGSEELKKGMLLKAHQKMALRGLLQKPFYSKSKVKYPLALRSSYKLVNKEQVLVSNYKLLNKINQVPVLSDFNAKKNEITTRKVNYKIDKRKNQRSSIKVNNFCGLQGKDLIQRFKIKRKHSAEMNKNTLKNINESKYKLTGNVSFESVTHHNRRDSTKKSRQTSSAKKFINIEGTVYKTTRTTLKKQDMTKLKSNTRRKILDSISSSVKLNASLRSRSTNNENVNISFKPGALIEIVRKKKLVVMKKRNELCLFYIKNGKCKRKENGTCPFVHDPEKVAVCTRFLRGSCTVSNCLFSHTLDKNKMPVCSYFLKGMCHKMDCHYRHVRVNPKAPVCFNFLKGNCQHGENCKKKHILICEDFIEKGRCPSGSKCLLSHRRNARVKSKSVRQKRKSIQKSVVRGVLGSTSNRTLNEIKTKKKDSKPPRYFEDSNTIDAKETPIKKEESRLTTEGIKTEIGNVKTEIENARKEEFEQKRERILAKIERMKRNYNVGISDCGTNLKVENSKTLSLCGIKKEHENKNPPCMADLPSYIPLSMPKEDNS